MPKVTYLPSQQTIELQSGESVLEAAQRCGIPIQSTCGGVATCSDCKVKVLETIEKLPRPTDEELAMIGNMYYITKERLSCQLRPSADLKVEVINPFEIKQR